MVLGNDLKAKCGSSWLDNIIKLKGGVSGSIRGLPEDVWESPSGGGKRKINAPQTVHVRTSLMVKKLPRLLLIFSLSTLTKPLWSQ